MYFQWWNTLSLNLFSISIRVGLRFPICFCFIVLQSFQSLSLPSVERCLSSFLSHLLLSVGPSIILLRTLFLSRSFSVYSISFTLQLICRSTVTPFPVLPWKSNTLLAFNFPLHLHTVCEEKRSTSITNFYWNLFLFLYKQQIHIFHCYYFLNVKGYIE